MLYLPDAITSLGTAVDTIRLMQLDNYVPALLVVGIGYRVDSVAETFPLRVRDFTPTVDPSHSDTELGMVGGASKFMAFIRDELKPWVQQRYDTDTGGAAYVGHSLAGLFGSYVLLNHPDTFRYYGLGSASLWWDSGVIFEQERTYAAVHDNLTATVFTSVGSYENPAGAKLHHDRLPAEEQAGAQTAPDMVSDMQRMVTVLRSRAYPGLTIESEVLPREFHMTAPPLNLTRSLRYFFGAPG